MTGLDLGAPCILIFIIGNASYVALQTKRNVVCVMEGEEGCSEVMARLAELT